jgi:hypothetical protein
MSESLKGLKYYETTFVGEFPIDNYFLDYYGRPYKYFRLPRKGGISVEAGSKIMQDLKDFEIYRKSCADGHTKKENLETIVFHDKDGEYFVRMSIRTNRANEDDMEPGEIESYRTEVFYNERNEKVDTLIKYLVEKYRLKTSDANKISLLISTQYGLDSQEFDIKIGELDVELNYGKEFKDVYDKILERLMSKHDKGLILFHGDPGTGKTSLIKYLASQINKDVIFVPPFMAESISSPDFISFLVDRPGSVLIIEDAERVLADRSSSGMSMGTSNILNLSDGILGDCLDIQIIATFNTSRDTIDKALLRKGRLIAEHKFQALSVEDSNKLLKHLGKDHVTNKPMTLTEIYNFDEVEYKSKQPESIGFRRGY